MTTVTVQARQTVTVAPAVTKPAVEGVLTGNIITHSHYELMGITCSDDGVMDLAAGVVFKPRGMPIGFVVKRVCGELSAAATGNALTVNVKKAGTTILNALLSIADGAVTGETSVFTDGASSCSFIKGDLLSIEIGQPGSIAAGKGLIIFLEGYRT